MSNDNKISKEKVYVIDTNVAISDPNFVKKLKGKILIPKTVLQELDKQKYGISSKARNIREFARYLDRNQDRIWFHDSDSYEGSNDEKIIKTATIMKSRGHNVVLVTNDILMGMIAKTAGLVIKKHELNRQSHRQLYTGFLDLRNSDNPDDLINNMGKSPNLYVLDKKGLYRRGENDELKRVEKDQKVLGLNHKNVEQRCALDAMMNDDIKLVTISGKAGTGKTLIAIAAGLEQVITQSKYKKLIVSRPIVSMGQDLGYLPGDIDEKLNPWMQPIFDNIEFLSSNAGKGGKMDWKNLTDEGVLQMEALSYIRGRSIPDQFIIIDEAQNLTRHEMKTIISRVGENTKIIMTGDIQQIDAHKMDSHSNGFTYVIEKFKQYKIAAHITLEKCERSELAELASDIL